jgi:hypothetical protein
MKDTGWPAFPYSYEVTPGVERHTYLGMTLRDYFAAKAMQGMLATSESLNTEAGRKATSAGDFATLAYLCADAMLEARSKQ